VVRVRYRVFGDRTDGTYLSIDSTHAHINMPAALVWAKGLDDRPITVQFDVPPDSGWRVATQLLTTANAFTFTAPNLQYLMDSPTELSAFALRTFTVADGARTPVFRIAMHHQESDADLDRLARDAEKIVREARGVFGEFAPFDANTYTFITDVLPWAFGDGMEHRNSTIVTRRGGGAGSALTSLLDTMSHEFFHSWNVERIRPRSLEPFDFDRPNMSGELWFAEGFTNYYGPLVLVRSGLTDLAAFAAEMGEMIDTTINSPGRRVRTLEEMSRFAPFADAAVSIDPTAYENTFISYYSWGGALGIGLDLTLRQRSNGSVTLDTFMRQLWRRYGQPGGRVPGYVDHPYTPADLVDALATVSGDRQFADGFFARYVRGHEVLDYRSLLAAAGLVLRPVNATAGFAGVLQLQDTNRGVRLTGATPFDSPAYTAGLDRDDVIVSFGGMPVRSAAELDAVIRSRRPGSSVAIEYERLGRRLTATLLVIADPRLELVPAESAGGQLSDAQKQFRSAWLSSRERVL
jgi:predicted metalloprotease with PDZ domain